MRAAKFSSVILGLMLLSAGATPAWAQFEEMIARVPHEANAMVLVNGDKVFASPLAKAEDWKANRQKMFDAGLAFLPPHADSGLMASHIDFEFMLPLWELAIFQSNVDVTAEGILQKIGGKLDKINGLPTVAARGDAYVVVLNSRLVSLFVPQNRQLVSRWVRDYYAAKTPAVSPYLKEAYGYAQDNGTPIILALDLEGMVTEDGVQKALLKSELAKKDPSAKIEEMSKVLASIRGVMLGITLKDKAYGKIKVDFDLETASLQKYGKDFLLHVLAKHGAQLDELESWEAKVSGKQVTLEGYFSEGGLQRLSTLFKQPMSIVGGKAAPPSKDDSQESIVRESTMTYYRGINKLLKDLKIDARGFSTMGQTALWMDRYASRIEELPVVNVDPELVQFANYAASQLRNASSTVRGGLAAGQTAAANVPTQYNTYSYGETWGYGYRGGLLYGGYVPFGYYGTEDVVDSRATWALQSQARTLAENAGTRDARTIIQQLNAANGQIRQKMSVKYMTEFNK